MRSHYTRSTLQFLINLLVKIGNWRSVGGNFSTDAYFLSPRESLECRYNVSTDCDPIEPNKDWVVND